MTSTAGIRCAIKKYRQRKNLSQEDLAKLVGVRRQAIYDMESGRYLPNTAVALRLAKVLDCTVEMLFVENPSPITEEVLLLEDGEGVSSRLALAKVREKIVGVPLQGLNPVPFGIGAADGLLLPDKTLETSLSPSLLANTILMLGCDPALPIVRDLVARDAPGLRVHTFFASSRKALLSLGNGSAHVAGTHFHHAPQGGGNLEAIRLLTPSLSALVIAFAEQEEGLMVASGNPLGIRAVEDLTNPAVSFVNREPGAALRNLFDSQLASGGIPPELVNGYDTLVCSHSEGAIRISSGAADAALGLRVVAEYFGLGFVPLAVTRCDLVIPSDMQEYQPVAVLLNILQSSSLPKELRSLPGYDTSQTGTIIHQTP